MTEEYACKKASRLLHISEGRLRRWARLGLIASRRRPRRGLIFDFQGLVALRAVKRLRGRGVSLRRIKECADTLRRLYPDLTQPLAQAQILGGGPLVLTQKTRRFTPEGQLILDFGEETAATPQTISGDQVGRLFLAALEKETLGEWEGAKKIYTLILALRPDHPDALVNLGNILYRLGFPEGAAAHYVKALEADPQHPEACFNLANILEEQEYWEEAAVLYRRSLKHDPHFPEAWFNLARVLERLGDLAGAREYWHRYLEMEPQGDWADFIKHRLKDSQGDTRKDQPPDPPPR